MRTKRKRITFLSIEELFTFLSNEKKNSNHKSYKIGCEYYIKAQEYGIGIVMNRDVAKLKSFMQRTAENCDTGEAIVLKTT